MSELLTQDRLKTLISYDPDTGDFSRLKYARKDKVVGWYDELGYLHIRLDYVLYLAHRLAWFYVYGEWPKDGLDHKDGNTSNNRILNLREADQSYNMFNARIGKRNKSGCKGVSWDASRRAWRATIQTRGKWKQIGRFNQFCSAIKARRVIEMELHGEFSRRGQ